MKSKSFLYVSLAVDFLIAVSKFVAAAFTGSSSMIAEGIHSVIDALSQVLLLWGIKKSKRQPDADRPYGYGRELYFWSFVVSLVIFIVGGCISFYQGLLRFEHPVPPDHENWDYAVLAIAFVFTSVSMFTAQKAFNKQREGASFWKAIRQSKDPSTFIVLLGDIADMMGLFIAFCGVYFGHRFHNGSYDGVASMLIGIILIAISLVLVNESKSLLMGETTSKKTISIIVAMAESDPAVIKVKKNFSMYLAPDEVILQLNTVFKDDLTTHQIIDAIERISKAIRLRFPRVRQIVIEPVAD